MWQQYKEDERRRTEQSENRRKARDKRMEELREAFKRVGKDFVPPEASAEDFSRFTSESVGGQERPFGDNTRLFSRLLKMLASLRRGPCMPAERMCVIDSLVQEARLS